MGTMEGVEALARAKRKLYLLAWPFGAAALLLGWALKVNVGTANNIGQWGLPLLSAYFSLIAMALLGSRGGRAITLIERSMYAIIGLALLVRFADILLLAPIGHRTSALADLLYWIPIVYILAHLAFARAGTAFCLLYFALLIGIGVSYVWHNPRGMPRAEAILLLRFYLGNAAYIVLLIAFSKLKELYINAVSQAQKMTKLANTDPIVGLANRRQLELSLHRELERAKRFSRELSLVFFDIDQFKHINDARGHERGDEVLRAIARTLKAQVRPSDEVGRWGGDEFLLIAPELTLTEATQMAERLRNIIASSLIEGVGVVTASFGVAAFPHFDSVDELLNAADRALGQAKAHGKNRVESEV